MFQAKEYTPFDYIDDILRFHKIKNADLSRATGISQIQISKIRNSKSSGLPRKTTIMSILRYVKTINPNLDLYDTLKEYEAIEKHYKEKLNV